MNPREGALKILYDININGAFSNIALNKELKNNTYSSLDRGLLTELVYGVLENQIYIDYVIKQFSTFELEKMNSYTLILLRLGVYQLLFLDKIPGFAAVNESVNLSKNYCKKTTGFINGVLRNIQRGKDKIKLPDANKDKVKYLSLKYSHPEWLVKLYKKSFDDEFVEELLKASNRKPELYVRINTLKIGIDECIDMLKADGYDVEQSNIVPEAVAVKGMHNIENNKLYQKGFIQIQDISSMLASRVLSPGEGELVLDLCSAPGGKATHMAQLMNNKGTVIARDVHEHKLKLIYNTAKRLGIDIIKTEEFSGEKLDKSLIGKVDKVLVDAPCSGLGIIRRKPEIKYSKSIEDIKAITKIQYNIIMNAAQYLKVGGELVYSTCTINPEENDHIVERFLENNSNYVLVDITKAYPNLCSNMKDKKTIQLYPNVHGTDGFFISKFKRID